jgi:hypothetical protein
MKEEIENIIDQMFPNAPNLYDFSGYKSSSGTSDDFNYLSRIISGHSWKDADYPPGLELIYNYWMDEGYISKTLLAITERYRNKPGRRSEKLISFTLDPLRRVNNLLMDYIKDLRNGEFFTSEERSLEYQNQYGYYLHGKNHNAGVDVRSNFHTAFNKLLNECSRYFRQAYNRTIDADAFPVLIALQDLNIILATGNNNQAVAFTKRARIELLIEQNILNRPEIGEYLKERLMVPYKQDWMKRVDTMKSLQGWNPVSSRIFNDLAETGEMILMSVRYVDWSNIDNKDFAEAWAGYFRNEIQLYILRYNAVTGIDLSND